MVQENFAENLRTLCSDYSSVSDICRSMEINRQQFAKYLNCDHRPSPYNLGRICKFFGVEEFEVLLPPDQFSRLLGSRRRNPAHDQYAKFTPFFERAFPKDNKYLNRFEGYYYSHFLSTGWDSCVIRSLVSFNIQGGQMYAKSIERFNEPKFNFRHSMKGDGVVSLVANRLYYFEQQTIENGSLSLTILNATYWSSVSILTGLTIGCSTERDRLPFATRVVFQWLGKNIDKREALAGCGKFEPDADDVDSSIVELLHNEIGPEEHALVSRQV